MRITTISIFEKTYILMGNTIERHLAKHANRYNIQTFNPLNLKTMYTKKGPSQVVPNALIDIWLLEIDFLTR